MEERNRHKAGRMARLKGKVEQLRSDKAILMSDKMVRVNAEVTRKLERMRAADGTPARVLEREDA